MKLDYITTLREKKIADSLNAAGYEAYFVGGCVRDAVLRSKGMMRKTYDIDIATDALPEQVKAVFSEHQVIETGIKHGTVTVILRGEEHDAADLTGTEEQVGRRKGNKAAAEVTTYRIDGKYTDSRHPDEVTFTGSIREDLARRDFTMNAIACDAQGDIYDPFGGIGDIDRKVVRAVGDAASRFKEDALRIMRALRFAAVLGFSVEGNTQLALFDQRHLLQRIASERIYDEFKKILHGKYAGVVLRKYVDVIGAVMPEFAVMKGFEQHNPYHRYDVLEHSIRALEALDSDETYMKLATLFHDIGKPDMYFMDENGVGHFYGHPGRSEEIVRNILRRMKADNFTVRRVCLLVKYHDLVFEKDRRLLKRWMRKFTPEVMFELLTIKRADNTATGNMSGELMQKYDDIESMMCEILDEEQCFSLKALAVGGSDIIALGASPGPEIGRILEDLLTAVVDGKASNDREALLCAAKDMIDKE